MYDESITISISSSMIELPMVVVSSHETSEIINKLLKSILENLII
jgi:hypothetical protein